MPFRYARHTNQFPALEHFYTSVIGLQAISRFTNHDGYDGIILGFQHADWQIEFTTTHDNFPRLFDADDHLVFYVSCEAVRNAILRDARRFQYSEVIPRNPYWQKNAIALRDPDGHTIIIAMRQHTLNANNKLTTLGKKYGMLTWEQLIQYVQQIPYGRNSSRTDLSLVLTENKGTCSSKHALLAAIALENNMQDVQLICGIYKMQPANTPGIGRLLQDHDLAWIPEAHCYLLQHGKRIDITFPGSNIGALEPDILEEIVITPDQVGQFKIDFHQDWMKKWLAEEMPGRSFEEVWQIREMCIKKLSAGAH